MGVRSWWSQDGRLAGKARRKRRLMPLPAPQQQFARQDRRDEALEEVADAIVVVARELEGVLGPQAQRRLGVGVGTAVDQHQRVRGQQPGQQHAGSQGRHLHPHGGLGEAREPGLQVVDGRRLV